MKTRNLLFIILSVCLCVLAQTANAFSNSSSPKFSDSISTTFISADSPATDAILDRRFNGSGKVVTPISAGGVDVARGVAIQPDDKIVVAGYSSNGSNLDFAIARYNSDGTLDASFDGDGKVTTAVGAGDDLAQAVAVQPDGKIVVAGYTVGNGITSFAVVRYNSDGSLDTSFDLDGMLVTTVGGSTNEAYAITIQPDNFIVVAGFTLGETNLDFAVIRMGPSGAPDLNFDGDGKAIIPVGSGDDLAYGMALAPDGKIVLAGYSSNGSLDFAVARLNAADGSLDTSFNSTGKRLLSIGNNDDTGTSVAVQPDGKIVVAGYTINSNLNIDFVVLRFAVNGSLDPSFGGTGIVQTEIGSGNDFAYAVAIQPNEKIIVVGSASPAGRTSKSFAAARYNANGTLDLSFDGTGKVITQIGKFNDEAFAVALQTDGRIVAAGYSNRNGNVDDDFAAVRYLADTCTYTISPESAAIGAAGGNLSVTLTTQNGCGWVAQSNASWITITSAASGTGNATVQLTIQPNNSLARSGTVTIGGRTFTVNQAAGCSYTVSPLSVNISGAGGTGTLTISAGAGCVWSVTSNASWITITSSANGSGNGTVQYRVLANPGAARTGTITAAGRTVTVNQAARNRTPFDFDGDGRADIAVFRPSEGIWYRLNSSNNSFFAQQFGSTGDKIVPADYDGDGRTDLAVFRPGSGIWYVQASGSGNFAATSFGRFDDIPVPADYDGDGKADIAVFRPSNGVWYRLNSSNGEFAAFQFGTAGDIPQIGDFDGDMRADFLVFRPSNGFWYLSRSSDGSFEPIRFGAADDIPAAADYDGDGISDIAFYRPSTGTWHRRNSANGQTVVTEFGGRNNIPVPADYDGDGRADLATYQADAGIFALLRSSAGTAVVRFGVQEDVPIPAFLQFAEAVVARR